MRVGVVTVDGKEYLVTKSGNLWPTPLSRLSFNTDASADDYEDEDRERSIRQDVINASFYVE